MSVSICGGSWGIGVNLTENGELSDYGFVTVENPHLFSPDPEYCTEKEIQNWEKAKKEWDSKL